MCHVDLSNCFRSLMLPKQFWGAFCVSNGEGRVIAFRCLLFGWKFIRLLCQRVLEALGASAQVRGVVALVYLSNVLLIGRGRMWFGSQAGVVANTLREAGAIMRPKS